MLAREPNPFELIRTLTGCSKNTMLGLMGEPGGLLGICRRLEDPALPLLPGINMSAMRRLRAALKLGLLLASESKEVQKRIDCPADVGSLLGPRLRHLSHEELWVVALNGQNEVIGTHMVSRGGPAGTAVRAKDILRVVLRFGAYSFILVHNHPSGSLLPSKEDSTLTMKLIEAGEAIGVPLVDHVIISRQGQESCVEAYMRPLTFTTTVSITPPISTNE